MNTKDSMLIQGEFGLKSGDEIDGIDCFLISTFSGKVMTSEEISTSASISVLALGKSFFAVAIELKLSIIADYKMEIDFVVVQFLFVYIQVE